MSHEDRFLYTYIPRNNHTRPLADSRSRSLPQVAPVTASAQYLKVSHRRNTCNPHSWPRTDKDGA